MNLVITLVMYILILVLVQGFRWNSAKDFFMRQEHSEQEYRKSLEQKNAALELAVQRETKANLAKRDFLFNMSNDIRTPMNAIIGFAALAQTHVDDRDQVEDYLKKISVSSQHLLSLINDVLDMSRIENGKVTLETKPVHLPELDSYEATRRICALPDKKKAALPIVAMTANAFEDDRKNALNAGMDGHIAKPLNIQKLFQVLSELLK